MHTGLSYWSLCTLSLSGTLQLHYNLGGLHEPFTIDLDQRNLANGQPHNVNLTRKEREIQVQVRVENKRVNLYIFPIFTVRKPLQIKLAYKMVQLTPWG